MNLMPFVVCQSAVAPADCRLPKMEDGPNMSFLITFFPPEHPRHAASLRRRVSWGFGREARE